MSAFQRIAVYSGDNQPVIQVEIHQWTLSLNGFYVATVGESCTITVRTDGSATVQYFNEHGTCVSQDETTWEYMQGLNDPNA